MQLRASKKKRSTEGGKELFEIAGGCTASGVTRSGLQQG